MGLVGRIFLKLIFTVMAFGGTLLMSISLYMTVIYFLTGSAEQARDALAFKGQAGKEWPIFFVPALICIWSKDIGFFKKLKVWLVAVTA